MFEVIYENPQHLDTSQTVGASRSISKRPHTSEDSVFDSIELESHDSKTLNLSSLQESIVSFADVFSSTPLPQYEDPKCLQPLDLSLSRIDESPLDCSIRNGEIEPLDLIVRKSQSKSPTAKTGEVFQFKSVSMFEYRSTCPGVVFYKTDMTSDKYFQLRICDQDTIKDEPLPVLNPLESEPIPLSYKKLMDLKTLMPSIGNKMYHEAMLKSLVVPKRGRKTKNDVQDNNFDDDLDKY